MQSSHAGAPGRDWTQRMAAAHCGTGGLRAPSPQLLWPPKTLGWKQATQWVKLCVGVLLLAQEAGEGHSYLCVHAGVRRQKPVRTWELGAWWLHTWGRTGSVKWSRIGSGRGRQQAQIRLRVVAGGGRRRPASTRTPGWHRRFGSLKPHQLHPVPNGNK